jgi:hypothetical protein
VNEINPLPLPLPPRGGGPACESPVPWLQRSGKAVLFPLPEPKALKLEMCGRVKYFHFLLEVGIWHDMGGADVCILQGAAR